MSTVKSQKLNTLLGEVPPGVVLLSSWLREKNYSNDLQKRYRKSGWLESIGRGAMVRRGERVGYEGALYALQTQLRMTIHPGARSAFALLGKAHYLDLAPTKVVLFGGADEKLPVWFEQHDTGMTYRYHPSSFLPASLGLAELEMPNFSIKVSSPARAMFECLYLAPDKQSLFECYELMEGLNNLRPNVVQTLLDSCRSVKVNRLFLYLAEKAGHRWLEYLNLDNVQLGRGARSLAEGGVFISKYQITVPKELANHDED